MEKDLLVCNLPEDCTIQSIRDVSTLLTSSWKKKRQLVLNLRNVESMDLTGVQLILSLYKTSAKENRPVRIADPIPGSVVDVLKSVGLILNEQTSAAGLEAVLRKYQEERIL